MPTYKPSRNTIVSVRFSLGLLKALLKSTCDPKQRVIIKEHHRRMKMLEIKLKDMAQTPYLPFLHTLS